MGLEGLLASQIVGLAEAVDDEVASLLVAGTGITITYNDVAGTLTIAASSSFDGSFAALTGKPTTLSGYGITDAQPLDSDLTAIAALTTTSFGRSLLTQADAAATRSTIGAGTGTIGGSTGSTDNAVLRADGTGGATAQDSSFVIADLATASPNNTVNHASLQAIGPTTNVSASVVPKGNGAFILSVPNGASSGGNARGASAVDLQLSRTDATHVASGSSSFVVGIRNVASGARSMVFGSQNTGSGDDSFVGGANNTASSAYATVAGGFFNEATQLGSSVLGGIQARADRRCMRAFAANAFATAGDCQGGEFVLQCTTTTNSAVEMLISNNTRLTIPTGKTCQFLLFVTGVRNGGADVAAYVRLVRIKNIGGTTSLVGSVATIGTDEATGTSISVTADNTNDSLNVSVTGVLSQTWRWNCIVYGGELSHG